MERSVESRLTAIAELCRRHHVRKLELFGSAATGSFDANSSDIDFLVEFLPEATHGFSGDYFGLKFDLEELFGREVDLVMTGAARNPYFLRAISGTRTQVYAA